MVDDKLDAKDSVILSELFIDGRALISKLSKITKIQRDSIKYRINRLKKNSILKSITANVDYEKLGYPTLYKVEINLQNFNLDIEEAFIHYLSEYPNVVYLENITGKFDLSVVIAAKNSSDFYDILKIIRSKYPEVMRDHEISTINKIIKFWDYRGLIDSK